MSTVDLPMKNRPLADEDTHESRCSACGQALPQLDLTYGCGAASDSPYAEVETLPIRKMRRTKVPLPPPLQPGEYQAIRAASMAKE